MTKALSILIQSLIMFIASHEYAEASQILAGSALFFFDGVATLGLLMSGLLVLLGYKLLTKGIGLAGPGGEIYAGVNALKMRVTQAVPGVVSAVLGLAGVVACMFATYAVN